MLPKASVVAVRKAIERTYIGTCVVIEHRKVKDEHGATGFEEVTSLENQPCKLSFAKSPSGNQTESGQILIQSVKLFLSPDIMVKTGSKITVTQNGVTLSYRSSGVPIVYETHQEIALELFKGWS